MQCPSFILLKHTIIKGKKRQRIVNSELSRIALVYRLNREMGRGESKAGIHSLIFEIVLSTILRCHKPIRELY